MSLLLFLLSKKVNSKNLIKKTLKKHLKNCFEMRLFFYFPKLWYHLFIEFLFKKEIV